MNCIIAILKRMFLKSFPLFLKQWKTCSIYNWQGSFVENDDSSCKKDSFRKYDFFNADARLSCTCISEDRNVNIFWTGFFLVRNWTKLLPKDFSKSNMRFCMLFYMQISHTRTEQRHLDNSKQLLDLFGRF